jgi:HSP20 family protein
VREEKEKGQYRMERSYRSFERAIELPAEVDESKAKAEFKKKRAAIDSPKSPGAQFRRKKIPVT